MPPRNQRKLRLQALLLARLGLVITVRLMQTTNQIRRPRRPKHRLITKGVVSKAQEAMDEAMREAARLTQMIEEEDARRSGQQPDSRGFGSSSQESPPRVGLPLGPDASAILSSSTTFTDDMSETANQGIHTPTSSQSDMQHNEDSPPQQEIETRAVPKEEPKTSTQFTSFDQIVPRDTALLEESERKKKEQIPPLTLHLANISIFDDSDPSDRSAVRSKPLTEYLIQVEPATSHYPGWMIVRRFTDFEALHQVLGRLSKITDCKDVCPSSCQSTSLERFNESCAPRGVGTLPDRCCSSRFTCRLRRYEAFS